MSAEGINAVENHTAIIAEKNLKPYEGLEFQLKHILQQKYLEGWIDGTQNIIKDLEQWNKYEGVFGNAINAAIERIKRGLPKVD